MMVVEDEQENILMIMYLKKVIARYLSIRIPYVRTYVSYYGLLYIIVVIIIN